MIPFYQRISTIIFRICFSRSCSPSWATKQTYFRNFTQPQTHFGTQNHQVGVKLHHWVPNVHVCHIVSPLELSFQTARMYYFNTIECEKIEKTIALHKNTLKIKQNCYYSFWVMLLVYLCFYAFSVWKITSKLLIFQIKIISKGWK